MEQGAYLSAPSNPWWRAKTWWSWSMSGTVASCVPAGQNTACPGWEEAWRPSGTNMMVCPGSDTRLTEVGSGSSSRSTPSTLSCMAQPVGMTTVEVSSLLAGLADASRSGCANDPRQAGSWRRRRLAGLPSSGCGPQRGTRWASGLRGGIFSMLVPMRSCLSVTRSEAGYGPGRCSSLLRNSCRLVSARHSVDSLGQSGCCYQDDWLFADQARWWEDLTSLYKPCFRGSPAQAWEGPTEGETPSHTFRNPPVCTWA